MAHMDAFVVMNPRSGKCEDCKYWDSGSVRGGYAECLAAHSSTRPENRVFLFRVVADDSAILETHRYFGCSHFEKKLEWANGAV